MKNYASYISVPDEIITAVNVEDEKEGYWCRYIPTGDFNELLNKVIKNFGRLSKESKSIWMQGIYGVGKSHTITVLKHLFYDDIDVIKTYTERHRSDIGDFILEELYAMRAKQRFLPVMITGLKNITQPSELAHTVQLEVRKTLQKYNIVLNIKDDFQTILKKLDDDIINWDIALKSTALKSYVTDKDDLRKRLEEGNKQLLDKVIDYFASINQHFSSHNLTDWMKEAQKELKEGGFADGIIIFWDEFTQFLESDAATRVFTEFQHLAELSNQHPIYLFLVTHKAINQLDTRISEREISKIMDRFELASFSRAEITTYKLLSSSIKRKEDSEFIKFRNDHSMDIEPVIRQIKNNSLSQTNISDDINNLFPFHPYTAFLSAEISRLIGSVNRTIFKFLCDEQQGFVRFLNVSPIDNQQVWLLPDKLFDYFEEDFSKIPSLMPFISQYRNNAEAVQSHGPEYLIIFKIIVLLIILKDFSGNDLLSPNDMNLDNALRGSKYHKEIIKCTAFLMNNSLIRKDLSLNYTMSTNSLPQDEVMKEISVIKSKYQNRLLSLLSEELIESIAFDKLQINSIRRPIALKFMSSYDKTQRLNNAIEYHYSNSPLDFLVVIYIADSENDLNDNFTKLTEYANAYNREELLLVMQLTNSVKQNTIDSIIRSEAEAKVASDHNFAKQAQELTAQRERQRIECISNLFEYQAQLFLCRKSEPLQMPISISDFTDVLQDDIFKKVYYYGFENIASCQIDTIWKVRGAQSSCAADFLELTHRSKLIHLKKHSKSCQAIFDIVSKTTEQANKLIVGDDMSILELPEFQSHPLYVACKKIREIFDKNKSKNGLNLGDTLYFLSQPPFGYYKASIHMAALGYLLKDLYTEFLDNQDQPLNLTQAKTIIEDALSFWQNNDSKAYDRLGIRFYTKEQIDLFRRLISLFNIKSHESRKQIRWEISSTFLNLKDNRSYPLWVMKYVTPDISIRSVIDQLQLFISNSELDSSIYSKMLEQISDYWVELKTIVSQDNLVRGFSCWLTEHFPETNLNPEDVEQYIRTALPDRTEVYAWNEDKLSDCVNKYIYQLRENDPTENDPQQPDGDVHYKPDNEPGTSIEQKRSEIIATIESDKTGFTLNLIEWIKKDDYFASLLYSLILRNK